MSTESKGPRLGILLSGGGSTYDNIAAQIDAGVLSADIAVVISSRADAYGLTIAKNRGHAHCVQKSAEDVTQALCEHDVEWVIMCGYMRFWNPPADFTGKTVNIHPGLLPAYGGKGMYGHHVHEAVVAAGERESGCTVHFVDGAYDTGPIIAQDTVPVYPTDSAEDVQARVQAAERALYPRALASLW